MVDGHGAAGEVRVILPPRQLFVRLVFWGAVLAWAVWKMRDLQGRDLVVPDLFGPPPQEITSPLSVAGAKAEPGDAPDVVDPQRAMGAVERAISATQGCGAKGTLGVRLGAEGLEAAWVRGAVAPDARACVERALGSATWPRTRLGFEVEQPLGAP